MPGGGTSVPSGGNLVVNGSFEQGPPISAYSTVAAGNQTIPGWTITKGTVDIVGTQMRASDGARSIDLIGSPGSGGLRQAINTVPGQSYSLSFDITANRDGGDKVKQMRVMAGNVNRIERYDTAVHIGRNAGWVRREFTFQANSARTVLEFSDPGDPGNRAFYGAILDNIVVVPAGAGGPTVVSGGQPGVSSGGNLVANGSFEAGPPVGSFLTLAAGARTLPGWTVTKGTVDLTGTYSKAGHGDRSLDLIGTPGSGGIRQVIDTVPGQGYQLSFFMAGNCTGGEKTKQMRVVVGSASRMVTFDTSGKSNQRPGWVQRGFTFTANSAQTVLEFSAPGDSNSGARYGPMLDNVAVTPVTLIP